MKKTILLSITLMFALTISKAQTAMQLSGMDCNGVSHDLLADLDAGKAVILHFFMPNCGMCPPPAQKIQAMANHILANHPGTITAYAMPFNNSTLCSYAATWVTSNNLSLYAPFDSGAIQVANYGGFGMPTVVLLGGTDHRVMFSTLSFSTSDTTIMRDSILSLLGITSGINSVTDAVSTFSVYPNPATDEINLNFVVKKSGNLNIEILDVTGRKVAEVMNETVTPGAVAKSFNTAALTNGNYFIRVNAEGLISNYKLNVIR